MTWTPNDTAAISGVPRDEAHVHFDRMLGSGDWVWTREDETRRIWNAHSTLKWEQIDERTWVEVEA